MSTLNINGKNYEVKAEPDTPLLWVIREYVGLTGTKYGCGIAQCGACSVHVNGQILRSCAMPLSAIKPSDKISKGYPLIVPIRFKRLGQRLMSRSAAIANRVKLWPQLLC